MQSQMGGAALAPSLAGAPAPPLAGFNGGRAHAG